MSEDGSNVSALEVNLIEPPQNRLLQRISELLGIRSSASKMFFFCGGFTFVQILRKSGTSELKKEQTFTNCIIDSFELQVQTRETQ